MKVLHVVVATSALAIAALSAAQGPGQGRPPMGGPGGGPGMGRMRMDPKQMADRMGQALGLTAAQKSKILAIYTKSAADQRKIRDAQQAAIKKVLTPAQQQKLASMRGPGGMRGGMGGPGGMRRGG